MEWWELCEVCQRMKHQSHMSSVQAVKDSIKGNRADRLLRVRPLTDCCKICDDNLARMLPKWLDAYACAAHRSGPGSVAPFQVWHSPEFWIFSKYRGVGYFMLEYGK